MQKPKILIHSIAFSPDGVSTAYLYNDLALKFKNEGYEVVILTTTPHYNKIESEIKKQPLTPKIFGLFFTSIFNDIKVIHIPQKKFKSPTLRIVGFIYWHVLGFALGLSQKNISIILSPSPPLSIGIINILIAKIKRAKVVYNVQEIYPDFLVNQGKLNNKLILSALKSVERYVYNKSDAVITIDEVFYSKIVSRFFDKKKLHIIPNFVDTEIYQPKDISIDFYNDLFPRKEGVLKIMYAGNIGHAQDWEPLLHIANALSDKKVEFWVVGEGVMKHYLENEIKSRDIHNIHLVPYQERNKMPLFISYADLHFIFMSPKMDAEGFPSKVYTIMACAKPLLVISSKISPIYNFLESLNCSYLIAEDDLKSKCNTLYHTISKILDNNNLKELGLNGFNHIKNKYSKDVVTSQYVTLVNEILLK